MKRNPSTIQDYAWGLRYREHGAVVVIERTKRGYWPKVPLPNVLRWLSWAGKYYPQRQFLD